MTIKKLILALFLVALSSLLIFNLTASASFALPKPYQDKINDAHKKKKEEKEKKKKEEEEKKDEEEKDDDEKDKLEPGERYLVPIIPLIDTIPRIKIIEVSIADASGYKSESFDPFENVNLKLKYRVTDYDGFGNAYIVVRVKSAEGMEINRLDRSNPVRTGDTVTEIFNNIVPKDFYKPIGSFRVEVEIDVNNAREWQTAYGYVRGGPERDEIKIHDVFLASDDYYDWGYWWYGKSEFKAGDPYRLVVRYEIRKGFDEDVEFEYTLKTIYDYVLDSGYFWDRAREGEQTAMRYGWLPYYLPEKHCRAKLEVRARYGGDTEMETSYFDIYEPDYLDSDTYDGYLSRINKPVLSLGPVYFSGDAVAGKYRSFFSPDENINVTIFYEYNGRPYETSGIPAVLKYVLHDPYGAECMNGRSEFFAYRKDKKKIDLRKPEQLDYGRYELEIILQIGDYMGTSKSYFTIDRNSPDLPLEKRYDEDPKFEQNSIEYQIDDNLTISLSSGWNAKMGYEPDQTPLVFSPGEDITGEVLIFDFDNPSITLEDAASEYEKSEKDISGIGEPSESILKEIDGKNFMCRFYDGKAISKGRFFEEKISDIKICLVYSVESREDSSRLYVIRMVSPLDKSIALKETSINVLEMIKWGRLTN